MEEEEEKSLVLIQYEYVTDPVNIAEILGTGDKFVEWLETGTMADLEGTLKVFEENELYEHCTIILQMINKKKIKNA